VSSSLLTVSTCLFQDLFLPSPDTIKCNFVTVL
jgi:hypothetical protein